MKKLIRIVSLAALLAASLSLGGCDNVRVYGSVGYSSYGGYGGYGSRVAIGGRIY
jgi:hypothetical protein